MALQLEHERERRIEAEHQKQEAQRDAQATAEKLSQAQSLLAEMAGAHNIDSDMLSQDSDRAEDEVEALTIPEAINGEYASLMAHTQGPDSGMPYRPDPDILELAARLLMSVVDPPTCNICHEGVSGITTP